MYYHFGWVRGTDISFTPIMFVEAEGKEYLMVHFERDKEGTDGADFADMEVPGFIYRKSYGYSESELAWLKSFMRSNYATLWEAARNGGEPL